MQSYCSDVTRYLLAASEGVCILSRKVVNIDVMEFAKLIGGMGAGKGPVRYKWGNPSSNWDGNFKHQFAADHSTNQRIVIASRTLDINVIERAFSNDTDNVAKQIADVSNISVAEAKAYFMCGVQEDGAHGEVETVKLLLRRTNLGNRSNGDQIVMAKTIVYFRVLRSMTMYVGKKDLVVQKYEPIRDAVDRLLPIFDDPKRFGEVMSTASNTEQMILHDMRTAPQGTDKADYVVVAARNRILGHLRGAGGFIVSCYGRKFEVSSRGDGSSGMFYREFVLGETAEKSGSSEYGGSLSVSLGVSLDGPIPSYDASVTVEANYSQSMGWSITTEENPTEWKKVHEKSFLDGLGEGPTSLGKLILMMNWHVGGLDEWFVSPTCSNGRHGCPMKEEPLPLDVASLAGSVKIDSYFRMGDLLAASSTDQGDWKTFLEYNGKEKDTLEFRKRGVNHVSSLKRFELEAGKNVAGLDQSFMNELVGSKKSLGVVPDFLRAI